MTIHYPLSVTREPDRYEPWIQVTYHLEHEAILLYSGSLYQFCLLTGDQDDSVLVFNFGFSSLHVPHQVRRWGQGVAFIPLLNQTHGMLQGNDQSNVQLTHFWNEYRSRTNLHGFVVSQQAWNTLGKSMEIPIILADQLPTARCSEILTLWLLKSHFNPLPFPFDGNWERLYLQTLSAAILVEEPEHNPSIKQVLQLMLTERLSIDEQPYEDPQATQVTAYWLDHHAIQAWTALAVTDNQRIALIVMGLLFDVRR